MTDRERLIELLEDTLYDWECDVSIETVTEIAEHLIENGVIVPPCKVGQTVYYNDNNYSYKRDILTFESTVSRFDFDFDTGEHIAVLTVLVGSHFFRRTAVKFTDFGKTVFLTREEAERKLRERESNE